MHGNVFEWAAPMERRSATTASARGSAGYTTGCCGATLNQRRPLGLYCGSPRVRGSAYQRRQEGGSALSGLLRLETGRAAPSETPQGRKQWVVGINEMRRESFASVFEVAARVSGVGGPGP